MRAPHNRQLFQFGLGKFTGIAAALMLILSAATLFAQVSGSISGTVLDSSGAAVPGAKVFLQNEASQDTRQSQTNASGYFTFAAVVPGSYAISVEAPNFKSWKQTSVVMHSGDVRTLSGIALQVGAASEIVEVNATAQALVPTDSGAREDVLPLRDIQDLPLTSRNVSELVKILPGVTQTSGGALGNGNTTNNFLNAGATGSDVGVGVAINGAAYRGGVAYLNDGANILDPGCNCWSLATIDSRFTQEVQVQASNFGADVQQGPVVINTIGKSGTRQYHGQGFFDARNDVLNANDWVDNHNKVARGNAHYYYPGGSFGGPVPFTKNKLTFWFGFDRFLQNLGNSANLTSFIPSSGMQKGIFNSTDPTTAALCPNLDASGNNTDVSSTHSGTACASINGMVLPDGTTVSNGVIPAQYLDPGAKALSSIWPTPTFTTGQASLGGANYYQVFPATHDGYLYRMRFDYDLNDSNKFYVSYQYATDAQPVSGTGAHVWYNPGNAIPFPGGGLQGLQYSKVGTGHFVHVFGPTMTNEFVASWAWDSGPTSLNLDSVARSKVGYTYGDVFKNPVTMIPSYNSAGNITFPDFSQADLFEGGAWKSKKQVPSFSDNVTKVWRTHTFKFGGFYQTVGNLQSSFSSNSYQNGVFSYGGQHPDYYSSVINPGGGGFTGPIGSSVNPTANFFTGIASFYGQVNSAPYQDMAYRTLSGYIDDSWKFNRKLTVEWGFRLEHIGRWSDRSGQDVGLAAFYPALVSTDIQTGRANPGLRYHAIDPGVPLGGSPVRLAFLSPRVGLAYDLFGTGKTVLRGGWGRYRWNDQVNDYLGMLQIAQPILGYSTPSNFNILMSEVGNLPAPSPGVATYTDPSHAPNTSTVYAADPTDRNLAYTDSYNFTISQQVKWNTVFEIGYVGSSTSSLLMGGQNAGYSTGGDLINRNKMPLGALFGIDPITGLVAADRENPKNTCTAGNVCNSYADYRPYGLAYGTTAIYVPEHEGWANYNGLQLSWLKPRGSVTFDLNYAWSKALGTTLGTNPYSVAGNYGELNIDRHHVINASTSYHIPYNGSSRIVRDAVTGWVVAGIFTWQSGFDEAAPNNYSPNFGFNYNYVNAPSGYGSLSIGAPTYFGTDASVSIIPTLGCNPTSGLASNQIAKLSCFAPPAIGSNSGNLPFIKGPAYWGSDLSIARTFHITERHNVEIRAMANNWLNHPLPTLSGTDQLQLVYNRDFVTGAVTASPKSQTWGFLDTKVQAPNQRIIMLSATYSF